MESRIEWDVPIPLTDEGWWYQMQRCILQFFLEGFEFPTTKKGTYMEHENIG